MNKPLIAIASLIYGDEFPPGVNYCNAVERAGGRPLYVCRTLEKEDVDFVLQRFDGLLLTGGGDLCPETLGCPAHEKAEPVPLDRDRTEIALARAFSAGGQADPGRLPRGAGAQRRPGRHALPAHLRPARGHHRPPEQGDAARGARRSRHAAAPHLRRGGHAARQFDPPPGRRIARAVLCAGGHEPRTA